MVTIKDVAREAGVSIATVSRVINNGPKVGQQTRQKVLSIMVDLGYSINTNARALVMQKSATLGVVIPSLTDPFFASLANGVETVSRQHGRQLLLSSGQVTAAAERQAISVLMAQRCDAMVVHSKMLPDAELIGLSQKVPGMVFIDRCVKGLEHRCIWLNNVEGGKIAARHLLSLNHTRVACISSHYDIDDPKLRLQGFNEVFNSHNQVLDDALCVRQTPSLVGGELAAQQLLATGRPFSAVFAYDDAMAIGAISVFEDNGFRVPEDISVIGFDDVLLCQYSRPKLTTLHYPIEEMAIHAAQIAVQCAAGTPPQDAAHNLYLPRLIKRASTQQRETQVNIDKSQ